jgi:hypothetical protein
MTAALWAVKPWLLPLPDLVGLAGLIAIGSLVFLLAAQLFGALQLHELKAVLARQRA